MNKEYLRAKSVEKCTFCSIEFKLTPYQISNPRKLINFFCSRKCVNKSRIGTKWSKERRKAFIPYWKGKKLSEDTKNKISQTRLFLIKEGKLKVTKGFTGRKHTAEQKQKISEKMSLNYEERYGERAEEEKLKRSLTHKARFKLLGLPPKSNRLTDYSYRKWRRAVLKRDNYECQICKSKDKLECDHLKSWVLFPDLRYEVSNGRVLCKPCHTKTPNFGIKAISHLLTKNEKQTK